MRLVILILILVVTSCASSGKKERTQFRAMLKTGKYQEAHKFIDTNEVFKDKKAKLLYFMEKGMIFHLEGKYKESLVAFEKAKELSDKLFTKSFSHKAKAVVANDTFDIYYGATYERSLLHFYQSLNHLILSQDEKLTKKRRRQELLMARAEVVAWDSFLKTSMDEKRGNSAYKDDLMAKLFGGHIHETVGTPADLQIALQLYKDAKKILFRNYNSYKTFNSYALKFKKNYSKLPGMTKKKIEKEFVGETVFSKKLKDFIDYKILLLTKSVRPHAFKKLIKRLGPTKDVIKKVKNEKQTNVTVLFQSSFIPPKIAAKQYFGLESSLGKKGSAGAKIGKAVLSVFAAKTLGLMPATGHNANASYQIGNAVVDGIAVKFELPVIDNKKGVDKTPVILEVYSSNGKKIKDIELVLVDPLGDIAEEAIAENSAWLYSRLGARLALKYVAAIATAYGVYVATAKQNKLFAKGAAVLSFMGASKAIEKSEVADTRYWCSLPSALHFTQFNLPVGSYKFILRRGNLKKNLGLVKILKNENRFLNVRI